MKRHLLSFTGACGLGTGYGEGAGQLLNNLFFDPVVDDLAAVGRYKINKKLELTIPDDNRHLTVDDMTATIGYLLNLVKGEGKVDVIDHLGNRRLRSVGELYRTSFVLDWSDGKGSQSG